MTTPLNIIKAKQKRSQYARHGYNEVLDFDDWCPLRIAEMREKGFVIKSFELKGVKMIGLKEGAGKPFYLTEEQFFDELNKQFKEEYLALFGLACEVPFEENVGIGQKTTA